MLRNPTLSSPKLSSTAAILKQVEEQSPVAETKNNSDPVLHTDKILGPLDIKDIVIHKKLQSGGFGAVYKATWNGKPVAAKFITFCQETPASPDLANIIKLNQKYFDATLNEIQTYNTLAPLASSYFIKYHGYTRGETSSPYVTKPYVLILDYLPKGDLTTYLRHHQPNWCERLIIMKDIAKAIAVLHEQKIIHSDLKDRNILMDENNKPKVIDFSLSAPSPIAGGTKPFRAPEITIGVPATFASDIFSLGMLFYSIATFAIRPKDRKAFNKAFYMGVRPSPPHNCPLKVTKIIDDCWRQDPSKRITLEALIKALEEILDTDLTDTLGDHPNYEFKWKADLNLCTSTFLSKPVNELQQSTTPIETASQIPSHCYI